MAFDKRNPDALAIAHLLGKERLDQARSSKFCAVIMNYNSSVFIVTDSKVLEEFEELFPKNDYCYADRVVELTSELLQEIKLKLN